MKRASPAQLRPALEVAHILVKHGVNFVCMPVIDEEDAMNLTSQAAQRLERSLSAQVASLQGVANSWQSGYDEGRRMGTKHVGDEVQRLQAENAGLKTGYQAYERVNAELKAEVEALRRDDMRAGLMALAAYIGPNCTAAVVAGMGKGEQS